MEPLDVVFMIDATGSMANSIKAAHSRATSIARSIRDQYGNSLDFRFATVCYRDPIEDNIPSEYCWFTRDAEQLASFFSSIVAKGGGDTPEDWAAAINLLFSLDWRSDSMKCVIWIADAPAHGPRYTGGAVGDNHPNLEYALEPLVIRLARGRIIFHGLDLAQASTTFREIQKIYLRNGGVSLTYETFRPSSGNEVATIGQLLHQKTIMVVQQTVLQGNAQAAPGLKRSGSILKMKPPTPSISTLSPQLSGILGTLSSEYTNIENFSINGGCGVVYSATRRSDSARVVIKHMILGDEDARKYFTREVDALRQFSHYSGCLGYLGSYIIGSEGIIVTPLMTNRDLSAALNCEASGDYNSNTWATVKSKIAFRLALTLKYIHSCGFVHRDLKPMNIFLNDNFDAVIGDWGLARKVSSLSVSGTQQNPTMGIGTSSFMAPELCGENDSYDESVDVFAWGIVIYAMFAKGQPLETLFDDGKSATSPQQVMMKIQRGIRYQRLSDIPPQWWTLICECWSHAPAYRPTAAAIVERMTRDLRSYLFPGTNEQQVREYICRLM
jgi:hypothetical protein